MLFGFFVVFYFSYLTVLFVFFWFFLLDEGFLGFLNDIRYSIFIKQDIILLILFLLLGSQPYERRLLLDEGSFLLLAMLDVGEGEGLGLLHIVVAMIGIMVVLLRVSVFMGVVMEVVVRNGGVVVVYFMFEFGGVGEFGMVVPVFEVEFEVMFLIFFVSGFVLFFVVDEGRSCWFVFEGPGFGLLIAHNLNYITTYKSPPYFQPIYILRLILFTVHSNS